MEPQNQISNQPAIPFHNNSKRTIILAAILGGIVLVVIGGYVGMQFGQSQQNNNVAQTTNTNVTPTDTNYVAPIQSTSDLTTLQTTLDNTDPGSITTNLSQNDTDASTF